LIEEELTCGLLADFQENILIFAGG